MAQNQPNRRFRANMYAIGRNLGVSAETAKRTLATVVLENIVPATPIQDGVARANWQAGLGAAPTGTVPPNINEIPGHRHAERKAAVAGHNAVAVGSAIIAKAKEGQTIWIQNNLPYIVFLNEGSSSQAPAGFVEATFIKARDFLRTTRLLRRQ